MVRYRDQEFPFAAMILLDSRLHGRRCIDPGPKALYQTRHCRQLFIRLLKDQNVDRKRRRGLGLLLCQIDKGPVALELPGVAHLPRLKVNPNPHKNSAH